MTDKTNFQKVCDFHEKFKLGQNGFIPSSLAPNEQQFRITCLQEEIQEYIEAVEAQDLAEQLDGLTDLIYFAYGTAHRNGFDIDTAFERVHEANMKKEIKRSNQRRGFEFEITKPPLWKSPNLNDLVDPRTAPFMQPNEYVGKFSGLIIIDGPDASGKTTLGKRIAEVTGGEYIHLTWSNNLEEQMDKYRRSAIDYASVLAKDKVVVLERAWLSHPIYSLVYREGEMHNYRPWMEACAAEQSMSILALPGSRALWFENYLEMLTTREEMYSGESSTKMLGVYNLFENAFCSNKLWEELPISHGPNLIRYDMFENNNLRLVDDWILNNVFLNLTEIK